MTRAGGGGGGGGGGREREREGVRHITNIVGNTEVMLTVQLLGMYVYRVYMYVCMYTSHRWKGWQGSGAVKVSLLCGATVSLIS